MPPKKETVEGLTKKLNVLQGSFDKISAWVNSTEISENNVTLFESKLLNLDELYPKFEETFFGIQDVDTEGVISDEIYSTIEDIYYGTKGLITAKLKSIRSNGNGSDKSETSTVGGTPKSHGNDMGIRLPKVDITKFSGKTDDWLRFYDTFRSLIHTNKSLHNIQRFHYLVSCLEGEALQVIDGIDISDDNYDFAWQTLEAHYKNNKLLTETHVGNLFEAKKLEYQSAKGLRDLHNLFVKNINALKKLAVDATGGDVFLVYLLTSKFDKTTLKSWEEESASSKEMPAFSDLEKFLVQHYTYLESFEKKSNSDSKVGSNKYGKRSSATALVAQTDRDLCRICSSNFHPVFRCQEFLKENVAGRRNLVGKIRCCWQCLGFSHKAFECKGRLCSRCDGKHNYLLCNKTSDHKEKRNVISEAPGEKSGDQAPPTKSSVTCCAGGNAPSHANNIPTSVIFPTVLVDVIDKHGQGIQGRFLLDSASELNFVSEDLARKLNLNLRKDQMKIHGIGDVQTKSGGYILTSVKSRVNSFGKDLKLYVIPKITAGHVLPQKIDLTSWNLPDGIRANLADPDFTHANGKLDGILGAGIFFEILENKRFYPLNSAEKLPPLTETKFGWVISGEHSQGSNQAMFRTCLVAVQEEELSDLGFQTQPTCPSKIEDESFCEKYFLDTTHVAPDGKFVVRLPFKEDAAVLGDSYIGAKEQFLKLERKLDKKPELKSQYSAFMREYLLMEHMELVPPNEIHSPPNYYLPHHAVFKESTTTSLRVVFNASYPTQNGKSLNSILHSGPALQNDVTNNLLGFRTPVYGLTGDLAKMYRCIWLDAAERDLQRIFWREKAEQPLQIYRLKTVTYGTKPAPFLAIRTLHSVANNIQQTNREIAQIIREKFLVDDLLHGADTYEKLLEIKDGLESALGTHGLHLRKWCSSSGKFMESLNSEVGDHYKVNLSPDDTVKTLGLTWNPKLDTMIFELHGWDKGDKLSKRKILSDINGFWDPLGILSPLLIRGKMFLQELWRVKLSWDATLPDDLAQRWTTFRRQIGSIDPVHIPRRVLHGKLDNIELHGFCDASEKAFGACIYVNSRDEEGILHTNLLCSKARVAPLSNWTLPRLELAGAVMLVQLMTNVRSVLQLDEAVVHYWTDSEIVLAWISGCPQQWKTFVANRVSLIQRVSTSEQWHHVVSADNPADLLSRGVSPERFQDKSFWLEGPKWLRFDGYVWPQWTGSNKEIPEKKKLVFTLVSMVDATNLANRVSSWKKLVRTTAYVLRFSNNIKPNHTKLTGELNLHELNSAKNLLVKSAQAEEFSADIARAKKDLQLAKTSPLRPLAAYLDDDGVFRVGGRLTQSLVPEARKHPIILPYKSRITQLILEHFHTEHCHSGPNTLLSSVRGEYWPINGKSAAKAVVRSCVTCRKAMPTPLKPMMAALPKERVCPGRCFETCGVDFCGPIYIKQGGRRTVKRKAYIALFICFATKAVHVELVSDMTSEAFIAALKRFFSRRGLSTHIYSDNGTNFVGALKELQFFVKDAQIKKECANMGTEWHFIPPGTPHFGGLWEASIKSLKNHLLKTVGSMVMTYEEASTVLTNVEAYLNSRPLTGLSDDPNDPSPLTPAHFLVGGPMHLPLEPDFTKNKPLTRRWQRVKQLAQEFWRRWSEEYLSSLQARTKWRTAKKNIPIGTLVVIKEENTKPMHWKMAKITALHPGYDGIARVATVNLGNGKETRRPLVKLCPILYYDVDEQCKND